jgi:N-methylhydantoinase A
VLTCDGGGTSTDVSVVLDGEPTLTTEGTVGAYPSKIPMIDVVTVGAGGGSIAWISPEGTLKVGPQSAGADPGPLCYRKGGTEPTITDAHVVLGRIPPHLLGGEIPLDVDCRARRHPCSPPASGSTSSACATGILEISAWNQANALRQVSVKRGLDVRDFMLTTFGGSGSLLACRLVDILDLAGVVVPPNPGNVSAFGLLTVDVKNDYVQTHVAKHAGLDRSRRREGASSTSSPTGRGGPRQGGLPPRAAPHVPHRRPALLRAGLRGAGAAAGGPSTRRSRRGGRRTFHAEHRQLYGYDFRDDPRQQVEWVNLRVTGIGPITRPSSSEIASGDGTPPSTGPLRRPGLLRRRCRATSHPVYGARTWRRMTPSAARPSSRSSARPSPSTPASPSASTTSATSSSPRRPPCAAP